MITSGGGALASASANKYCSKHSGQRTSARAVARGGTVTSSRHRGQRTMVISFLRLSDSQVYFEHQYVGTGKAKSRTPNKSIQCLLSVFDLRTTHLLTTCGVLVQSLVSQSNR